MKEFKVVVLGCGGVGKSSLTIRYVAGQFVEKYDPTIEDFYRKEVDIDGTLGVIEIQDTAGTEQFASMRDLYIKNGQGYILVYSIVNLLSFIEVQPLRDQIQMVKGTISPSIVLVGNKCDLENERVVNTSDGENLAAEWGVPFFETSALTKKNVDNVFVEVVRAIIRSRGSSNKLGECCTVL